MYKAFYSSPMGELILAGDENGLTGLWFTGAKYFGGLPDCEERELPLFSEVRRWLDIYFSGKEPDFTPPIQLSGTDFQLSVWEELLKIPYGKTVTYGELARIIARKKGVDRMSAQAIGGAVGRNKISIIVPCHRVVGADGSLTGYAGGLDKKIALLKIEGALM